MIFGNISGLVNGTEQVVFDYEVTGSAVSSIDTGNILNGDEDEWYTIIIRHVAELNSAFCLIRPNGDSGANYGRKAILATSTTVSDGSATSQNYGFPVGSSTASGNTAFSVTKIYAKSGSVRLFNSIGLCDTSGTTVTQIATSSNVWTNTADNIVSFTFLDAQASLGVGTRIIILKSNNFTNGTPTGIITTPYIKGCWVRVGTSTLGSATNSVTFSGLDGDRDVIYYLSAQAKIAGATGGGIGYQINADTTSGVCGQQVLRAGNTSVTAERFTSTMMNATYAATSQNNYLQAGSLLFAKQGFIRPALSWCSVNINGTSVGEIDLYGNSYNVTNTNITSIVVVPNASTTWDTGSIFELYALRPNG